MDANNAIQESRATPKIRETACRGEDLAAHEEWNRETGRKKLPERVKASTKTARKK
jgi:hypothetical protein